MQPLLLWKSNKCYILRVRDLRVRRIILPYVACPAPQYSFPHFLINDTIFGKEKLLEKYTLHPCLQNQIVNLRN